MDLAPSASDGDALALDLGDPVLRALLRELRLVVLVEGAADELVATNRPPESRSIQMSRTHCFTRQIRPSKKDCEHVMFRIESSHTPLPSIPSANGCHHLESSSSTQVCTGTDGSVPAIRDLESSWS